MKNKAASQLGKLSWEKRKQFQSSDHFKKLAELATIARKKKAKAKKK